LTIFHQKRNPSLNSSRRCRWSGTTCHQQGCSKGCH